VSPQSITRLRGIKATAVRIHICVDVGDALHEAAMHAHALEFRLTSQRTKDLDRTAYGRPCTIASADTPRLSASLSG